jgi:hypothetical protein
LEDPSVDERIILNGSSRNRMGTTRNGFIRLSTGGGLYEHGDKPSGSIKSGEFLEQLPKKHSTMQLAS